MDEHGNRAHINRESFPLQPHPANASKGVVFDVAIVGLAPSLNGDCPKQHSARWDVVPTLKLHECFGGFLLLSARAGDLFGFKGMLLWGIAQFSASSLVIGLAQTPLELIGARAVQGVGASMIAPSVLSLISEHFREGEGRSRALAWYSMVAGAGASLGIVMGYLPARYRGALDF